MAEEHWQDVRDRQEREAREKEKREEQISSAKAKLMLESYKKNKAKKLLKGDDVPYSYVPDKAKIYEYDEGVRETEKYVEHRYTRFIVYPGGRVHMWRHGTRRQKFVAVSGPLAGQRLTDDHDDYVLYNCAGFNRGTYKKRGPPRCVLVHRSSFEEE